MKKQKISYERLALSKTTTQIGLLKNHSLSAVGECTGVPVRPMTGEENKVFIMGGFRGELSYFGGALSHQIGAIERNRSIWDSFVRVEKGNIPLCIIYTPCIMISSSLFISNYQLRGILDRLKITPKLSI